MQVGLGGLRVVDLSVGVAAAYCCRLLTDAGADVVKVEPPDGDPWRCWTASGAPVDRVAGAPLFRFLHHGVRSVVGAPGDPAVADLVAGADVVVEGGGLLLPDRDALLVAHPGLVVLSMTPFGTTGPYADRPWSELTIQAEAGALVSRGHPRGVPTMAGGRISEWVAGTFAAVAVTAAAWRSGRTGHGEHVDFSVCETMVIAGSGYADHRHAIEGHPPITTVSRHLETPSIEPTVDGYVGFCTNSRQQFDDFLVLIERPDLLGDDDLARSAGRQARWDEWNEAVHAWTTRHSTAEVVERARELRIPVAPVLDGRTVLECEHFDARGVFVPDPTGAFRMPRRPWRMDGEDPPPPRPAPRLGEHTGAVEGRTPSRPPAPVGERRLPLEGLRVLDLTAWWAGPVAAGMLATLGADVIHLESPNRVDGMRMTGGTLRIEGPWWERSSHYLCANVNKRGLTLDLRDPAGLAALEELIRRSDAVLENFTPRVLANFGLGWERVQELNPRCTLVRMPAFGLDGPWRDNTGFAQTMEQVTGLAWLTSHPDDQPRIQRGPSDPNAGMHAAFALLVGLVEREVTGRGCHLEVAMVEGALNAAAEQVIEHTAHGVVLERAGNRGPNVAPQGVYRARGFDAWLALTVADDTQWAGLVAALGSPSWATDADLAGAEGRRRRHDELDARLAEWCADRDPAEAADLLAAHGVPAAAGRDPRLLGDHPQLRARRFLEQVDHPVSGPLPTPSVPFRFAGVDRWIRRAAPRVGEDNDEILGGELGMTDDERAVLAERGVIGTRPAGL